jgi:hypothetical protein
MIWLPGVVIEVNGDYSPVLENVKDGRKEVGATSLEGSTLNQRIRLGLVKDLLVDVKIERTFLEWNPEPICVVPGRLLIIVVPSMERSKVCDRPGLPPRVEKKNSHDGGCQDLACDCF